MKQSSAAERYHKDMERHGQRERLAGDLGSSIAASTHYSLELD